MEKWDFMYSLSALPFKPLGKAVPNLTIIIKKCLVKCVTVGYMFVNVGFAISFVLINSFLEILFGVTNVGLCAVTFKLVN